MPNGATFGAPFSWLYGFFVCAINCIMPLHRCSWIQPKWSTDDKSSTSRNIRLRMLQMLDRVSLERIYNINISWTYGASCKPDPPTSSAWTKARPTGAERWRINLIEAPIETPGNIGVVDRYHPTLRAIYTKLWADLSKTNSDSECLEIGVIAVNHTIGPEGLCATILVFGSLPRPARTTPSVTQLERAKAIQSTIREGENRRRRRG